MEEDQSMRQIVVEFPMASLNQLAAVVLCLWSSLAAIAKAESVTVERVDNYETAVSVIAESLPSSMDLRIDAPNWMQSEAIVVARVRQTGPLGEFHTAVCCKRDGTGSCLVLSGSPNLDFIGITASNRAAFRALPRSFEKVQGEYVCVDEALSVKKFPCKELAEDVDEALFTALGGEMYQRTEVRASPIDVARIGISLEMDDEGTYFECQRKFVKRGEANVQSGTLLSFSPDTTCFRVFCCGRNGWELKTFTDSEMASVSDLSAEKEILVSTHGSAFIYGVGEGGFELERLPPAADALEDSMKIGFSKPVMCSPNLKYVLCATLAGKLQIIGKGEAIDCPLPEDAEVSFLSNDGAVFWMRRQCLYSSQLGGVGELLLHAGKP